jgi:hypothetical protein
LLAAAALLALRPPAHLAETFGLLPPLVRAVPPLLVVAAAARLLARLAGRVGEGLFVRVPDAVLYVAGFFGARVLLAAGYVGPYSAFFLPLATVVAAAGLFRGADRLAARVEKSSASPSLPRLLAAALLLFALFRTASLALLFRHPAWSRVETPAGTLYLTEPVAGATRLALEDLPKRSREGTAVGFPETGFFNYVLGLESPLPQEQFFPGHLDAAAEREAIRTLLESPPDAILYANVLAVGHGQAAFGRDYLTELDRAVRSHFRPAASYGPGAGPGARIGDPGFFVEIRTRREAAP